MLTFPAAAVVFSAPSINLAVALGCGFAVVVLAVTVIWRYWRGTSDMND
jgi:hypothetical protein